MVAAERRIEKPFIRVAVLVDAEICAKLDRFPRHRRAAPFHVRAESDVHAARSETKPNVMRVAAISRNDAKMRRLKRNPYLRRGDRQMLSRAHIDRHVSPAR